MQAKTHVIYIAQQMRFLFNFFILLHIFLRILEEDGNIISIKKDITWIDNHWNAKRVFNHSASIW